jgi:hypothetical protein
MLAFLSAADLDGDSGTPNLMGTVLVESERPTGPSARTDERPEPERARATRGARRAAQFVRIAERWTTLLRRFQRAILTDIPI